MKTILKLAGIGLLSACTAAGSVTTPKTGLVSLAATQPVAAPAPAMQNITQFTAADLTNAIAIAQAAVGPNNPQAQMIVNCFTLLKTQLAALQPPAGSPTAVGVATAFTVADLTLGNLSTAASATAQAQYAIACGPLVIYTQNQGMALSAQIASLGVLIAK